MEITGIICEYNPLHNGHAKQLRMLRQENPEGGIVCLMSGNYVQRGAPAIFHKALRTRAALQCGADLVLELPVTASLSSAEGFASESVRMLSGFCHKLSFGAETPDTAALMGTAHALLAPSFSEHLKNVLAQGLSFPAARQAALESQGQDGSILSRPNNILAVEYCKAIIAQRSSLIPAPILRNGDYHDGEPDIQAPSATSLRHLIENGQDWLPYTPAADSLQNAAVHTLHTGENAIVYRLKTMTDEEYEQLPYGSEGLWRKLMKNARSLSALEDILTATKSKRYTRTRLDRMVMCAFLGLTARDIAAPAPYTRVLGFTDKGRSILSLARACGEFPNSGEKRAEPYQMIETRCDSLYGLFAQGQSPEQIAERPIYFTEE